MNATDILNSKAQIWHAQIAGVLALAERLGQDAPDLSAYYDKLRELYRLEGALALLQETADIVVRAQGPAVVSNPALGDINWLFGSVQQQFKSLVAGSGTRS